MTRPITAIAVSHPLPQGTWILSHVAVSDHGDHNERNAGPGALGQIGDVSGPSHAPTYEVVYWPSFIANFLDAPELDVDAEVLPADHPDIPSVDLFGFASAIADIVAEGDIDEDEGTMTVPETVVARILGLLLSASVGDLTAGMVRETLGIEIVEVTLSYAEFDRLAAQVGVGDRLSVEVAEAA